MVRQALLRSSFLCFFWLMACKNPQLKIYHEDDINLFTKGGITTLNDSIFSGVVIGFHPESKDTASIRSFVNGKEDGVWKQFYESGNLKESRFFAAGKKTGEYHLWWENGTEKAIYRFENDEYEGESREWNPEGRLIRVMNYKAGYEEGLQQLWYDNGKIKANYQIINGRRFGLLGTKNCVNVKDSIF